jgi:alcohol dehydrogenase class IV
MLKTFNFVVPTKIIFGENAIAALPQELKARGCKRVLLVTDVGIVRCGIADQVHSLIKEFDITLFDGAEVNPTEKMIDEGASIARRARCEAVVAVGGGSSLDTGKAIAMLITNDGCVMDYATVVKPIGRAIAPLFTIPTTAGTGSEVTKIFVVKNSKTQFKAGFKNDLLSPAAAFLDPHLSVGLPSHLTATTGMDALSHAIEGYTTHLATFMTDLFNFAAIELIANNLVRAVQGSKDLEARGNMLLASCITGCAFPQSGLGLVHAIAHALGGKFGLPHGTACAVMLPAVSSFNHSASPVKYARIARVLGVPGLTGVDEHDAALVGEALGRLLDSVAIPRALQSHGISAEAIPALMEDSLKAVGMIRSNAREASAADIEQLIRSMF